MIFDRKKIAKYVKPGGMVLGIILVIFTINCFSGKGDHVSLNKLNELSKVNQELTLSEVRLLKEAKYVKEASDIIDYYYKNDICMRFYVVKEMLKAIDKYINSYFPEGPYSRQDFIAIALTETTNLNQYTMGGYGERGLFQIMPSMCKAMGVKKNHFDIYVNTELSMKVLKEKYKKHKDYRDAIIAYNGFLRDSKGRVIDKYWKRFIKYRRDVGMILEESIDLK